MAKVLVVLDAKYPFDIRIEKELSALAEFHDITLACSRDSDPSFAPKNFKIERILPSVDKKTKLIQEIFTGLFFRDPLLQKALRPHLALHQYDLIHIHDLPGFKTVYRLRGKAKVILDLHENYPEASQIWHQWRKSKLIQIKNAFIHSFKRWKRHEGYAVTKADIVIAVVDEMKTKLCIEHGISPEKVHVITNSETKSFTDRLRSSNLTREELIHDGLITSNAFNLHYVGGIGPHRGLDDAINGVAAYSRGQNAKRAILHIVGGGHSDNIRYLKSVAEKAMAESMVKFHSSVPFNKVAAIMMHTDLNIIPHKSNGHCDNTIPHKLFQCMMTETPLLVSSSPPLARHIQPWSAGFVFEAENPTSFADVLQQITSNPNEAQKRGIKARAILEKNKWYWENTASKLQELYNSISKG